MKDCPSIQIEHGVHLGILHLGPNLRTYDVDFFLRIAQLTGEDCVGESLETFADLQVIPGADFFLLTVNVTILVVVRDSVWGYQMFICRPSPDRPDEFVSFDIHEASILHPPLKKRSGAGFHIDSSRGFEEFVIEFETRMFGGKRAVRRFPSQIQINVFRIAS